MTHRSLAFYHVAHFEIPALILKMHEPGFARMLPKSRPDRCRSDGNRSWA